VTVGFIERETPIVTTWYRRLEHGYDHLAMQGVGAVDYLLAGVPEHTVRGVMGVEPLEVK